MPIEFRCSQCSKLLRTGDDTAGKQAKCPECGGVMTVPTPDQGPFQPNQPNQPIGGVGAASSPFGAAAAGPAAPDSTNPYQSPGGFGPEPGTVFAPLGEIRPTRIDFGETLSRAWAVFTDRWSVVLGALVIVLLINVVASFIMQGMIGGVAAGVRDRAVIVAISAVLQIVFQVFALWLGIGLQMFALGVVRGEEPSFGLLFSGGRFLLSIVLCALLTTVIVMCGLILLIIPGFIFMFMLLQAQLLIIDRNMGVIDAMSMSREVMAGNKLTVFAIGIVATILGLLFTVVTCGIGYFGFIPYMTILNIVIYLGVTGQPTLADRYMMPPEQPGGTPFGQPTQETPPGDSPFGP